MPERHAGPQAGGPVVRRFGMRATLLGDGLRIARALPQKDLRMVGPWVFLDHIGPVTFAPGEGVNVAPHPHTALQTVTWLVAGELLHRDSLGSEQVIRPGQLNLMTAGHGISHSEESPPDRSPAMHGVQFWVALPRDRADIPPAFDHYDALPVMSRGHARVTVLMGELEGMRSPAITHWPMTGVDIACAGSGPLRLALDARFEHALLLLQGRATLHDAAGPGTANRADVTGNTEDIVPGELVYLGTGRARLVLDLHDDCRAILLGGLPFAEPVLIWWNFVAHDEEALRRAQADWPAHAARFGTVAGYAAGPRLEAPELPPNLRLKPSR